MNPLSAYLQRIGYDRPVSAGLATLSSLHRAHLMRIPYENLDIHFGRRLSLDPTVIFDKLVTAKRGGWCYEMNGLFAWVLREVGFKVTLLAGTVGRQAGRKASEGNHLVLLVTGGSLDQPYLADVGFGNGFLDPLPLKAAVYKQGFLSYSLSHDNGRWLFQNHADSGDGFDFTLEGHLLADFAERCDWLQSSPESSFVQLTVCHRFMPEGIITLRGCVLRRLTATGVSEDMIEDKAAYQETLEDQFDLHLSDMELLWQKVWQNHVAWMSQQ